MKKLLSRAFIASITIILLVGGLQSATAGVSIGYCPQVCCSEFGCADGSTNLCYCPQGAPVVNCAGYCAGWCAVTACP